MGTSKTKAHGVLAEVGTGIAHKMLHCRRAEAAAMARHFQRAW